MVTEEEVEEEEVFSVYQTRRCGVAPQGSRMLTWLFVGVDQLLQPLPW